MSAGIYYIENNIDDRKYIGGSMYVINRIKGHINNLRKNKHSIKELQDDWNKHGEENFKYDVIEYLDTSVRRNILSREQFWQDKFSNKYNKAKSCTRQFTSLEGFNLKTVKNLCIIMFDSYLVSITKNYYLSKYDIFLKKGASEKYINTLLNKYNCFNVIIS